MTWQRACPQALASSEQTERIIKNTKGLFGPIRIELSIETLLCHTQRSLCVGQSNVVTFKINADGKNSKYLQSSFRCIRRMKLFNYKFDPIFNIGISSIRTKRTGRRRSKRIFQANHLSDSFHYNEPQRRFIFQTDCSTCQNEDYSSGSVRWPSGLSRWQPCCHGWHGHRHRNRLGDHLLLVSIEALVHGFNLLLAERLNLPFLISLLIIFLQSCDMPV